MPRLHTFTLGALLAQYVCLAQSLPQYTIGSNTNFSAYLTADIAASSFVDADGEFHFLTSVAAYASHDEGGPSTNITELGYYVDGSFTITFTNDDFGAVASGYNTTTKAQVYDSYWNRTGTMCYQLDKRAVNPMPSLYSDDHCDVVGVWIDPEDETWYGVVNDEYQFDPWVFTGLNQSQRIATGRHNNRVLMAESSDKGATWEIVDQIVTDIYQPNQTITKELFPNTTYSWGLSGVRFFADYATGYAYCQYNHQIRNIQGDATLIKWFNIARAPLTNGLAPFSWKKHYNGSWDQPGIGGKDGLIGEPLNLEVVYEPQTDYIAYEGTGADGSMVIFQSHPFAVNGSFTFTDVNGTIYAAHISNNTLNRVDTGEAVAHVSYHDPALDRQLDIGLGPAGAIVINSTDEYGVVVTYTPKSSRTVFKDTTTDRLYVQPTTINESAFMYNVASGNYRSVGYDNYVYENWDMGKPNSWIPVGIQPAAILGNGYISSLDTGSLTNQNIGSGTYAILSDLSGQFTNVVTMEAGNSSLVTLGQVYQMSVGSSPLSFENATNAWLFEAVPDPFQNISESGIYRIINNSTGQYLQTSGSLLDQRKFGATVNVGAKQPEYDPSANGGFGSGGGSDQWYFLPVGANTPVALDGESTWDIVESATNTSLRDACGYKLVNRNSLLVLSNANETFVTDPNVFARNEEQKLSFTSSS